MQSRRARARARLGGIAVDTAALREVPAFRRLLTGQVISLVGRQITVVAVPYQVFKLTGSEIDVGLLGLAQVVPLMTASVLAGNLADRMDRRRLLLLTQLFLGVCSVTLLLGALSGNPPGWFPFVVVGVSAAVGAIDSPTRTAILTNIVGPARLQGALSLNFGIFAATTVAGPAVGGLVLSRLGLAGAYLIDAATFVAAWAAVWSLPAQPSPARQGESRWEAILGGLRFVRRQPVILGGAVIDLVAMIFGLPRAVFPVLALQTFAAGTGGLGLLYAAPGIGAALAAVSSGWQRDRPHLGRVVIVMVAGWGLAIVVVGIAPTLWMALLFLAVAGAADSFSAVCRSTMMQTLTPDELRGRVNAFYFMVVAGGPFAGDLEAGMVAGVFTPRISVVSGGALCLAGLSVAAAAFPAMWRYRQRGSGEVSAEV